MRMTSDDLIFLCFLFKLKVVAVSCLTTLAFLNYKTNVVTVVVTWAHFFLHTGIADLKGWQTLHRVEM